MTTPRLNSNQISDQVRAQVPDEVYNWLVEVIGFPMDLHTDEKPAWLDITRLAEAWLCWEYEHLGHSNSVDEYVEMLYAETGWRRG